MRVEEFLSYLEQIGVEIWLKNEGELAYRAPKSVMNDEILASLKSMKNDLINYLRNKNRIIHNEYDRFEPFPLTNMQSAYYSGMSKVYELGGTGCQTYIKMRLPELDVIKFEESWYKTIQKHDMLRMHINEDGTQQVVRDVERPHIEVSDEKQLEQISEEMSIYNFEVDEWPKHMFKVTKCSSFVILHFCIDMLIADYISINIILNDVFKFYFGEQDPFYKNSITFRDIVMHRECKKNTIVKEKAYLEAKKILGRQNLKNTWTTYVTC